MVVRGRVLPRKARVYQVLQQRRRGGFRTVATTALKVPRDGRFRGSFAPARSGTYRFYVVARGDHATTRSSSSKLLLRVGRSRGGGATAP